MDPGSLLEGLLVGLDVFGEGIVWANVLGGWDTLPSLRFPEGDPPELAQVYKEATAAIDANPDDVDAHFRRGVVCQSKRWYAQAIADFSDVIRRQPRHARAWLLLSEVLAAIGKHEVARQARQQAIEIDPGVGWVLYRGRPLQRRNPPHPRPSPRSTEGEGRPIGCAQCAAVVKASNDGQL